MNENISLLFYYLKKNIQTKTSIQFKDVFYCLYRYFLRKIHVFRFICPMNWFIIILVYFYLFRIPKNNIDICKNIFHVKSNHINLQYDKYLCVYNLIAILSLPKNLILKNILKPFFEQVWVWTKVINLQKDYQVYLEVE